jgi:DNA ligase D-like protein (predicted 3'-phosphoesterase)
MNKLRYVIQLHDAKHRHWDLRLELDGVAKSWTIPKEPPTEEGIKRLAVSVEDHDIDYMSWEGTIPKGQYGAGTVKIWDKGYWKPESIHDKKIVAVIEGKKLKGRYTLLNFKGKNWLFFKANEKPVVFQGIQKSNF